MKNILRCLMLLHAFPVLLVAQVWTGRDADFSLDLFGGSVYAINETTAWAWAIELDSTGFLSNKNNEITLTTNGGLVWEKVPFPYGDNSYITSISALDDQVAWVTFVEFENGVQGNNFVVKTSNRGLHWEGVDVDVTVFVDFIYMWNLSEGIVAGDADGNDLELFLTTDGESWTRLQNVPDVSDFDYIYADNYTVKGDELWFATAGGKIFHTRDKGQTWDVIDGPFSGFDASAMGVSDDGDIYLSYYQYVSPIDGGESLIFRRNATDSAWVEITEDYHAYFLYNIKSIPGSTVVMSTVNDWINAGLQTRISYDKGDSWIIIDEEANATYFDFFNPEVGYASQFHFPDELTDTQIYQYSGSPLTSLLKNAPLVDVNVLIGPNPTADIISIQLSSDSAMDYWIMLNDVSGKLLRKESFSHVKEINHQFDMQSLPPGIYTITIANELGMTSEKITKSN